MIKKIISLMVLLGIVCSMTVSVFAEDNTNIDYAKILKEYLEGNLTIDPNTKDWQNSNPTAKITIKSVEFDNLKNTNAVGVTPVEFKIKGTATVPFSGKWGLSHLTLVLIDKNNQNNQIIKEMVDKPTIINWIEDGEKEENYYEWKTTIKVDIAPNNTYQDINYSIFIFESTFPKYQSQELFVVEGKKEAKNTWGESGIKVAVNGEIINFPDQTPLLDTNVNRTYVPVRFLAEALGAQVNWDGTHQVVIIKNYGIEGNNTRAIHYLKMGENKLVSLQYNEGFMKPATAATVFYFPEDIKPVLVNDRTMLPFRYVAELLGSQVYYDKNTGTAHCVKRYLADIVPGKLYQYYLNGQVTVGNITDAKINDTSAYDSYPIVSTVIGEYFADEVDKYRKEYYNSMGRTAPTYVFDGEIADVNTWACFDHLLHPEYYGRDIKGLGYMHVYSNWLTNGMKFEDTITNVNGTWVQNQKYVIGALKPFYKEYYGSGELSVPVHYFENGMTPFPNIFNYGSKDTDKKEIAALRNDWGFYIKDGATFSILDEVAYRKISKKFIADMNGSASHKATIMSLEATRIGISIVGNYAYSGETDRQLP